MALIKIKVFTDSNSLSTLFYHLCRSIPHFLIGIIQFGDHFRSGIICGPVWGSFPDFRSGIICVLMGPFLEGPEKFSQSRGKISNLLITGLFYSHILYINRDSILYNKFKANTLSVFNYLNYRLTKKGFFGPEKCPGLSRNGPHRPFE